jgi:hypothetical protein
LIPWLTKQGYGEVIPKVSKNRQKIDAIDFECEMHLHFIAPECANNVDGEALLGFWKQLFRNGFFYLSKSIGTPFHNVYTKFKSLEFASIEERKGRIESSGRATDGFPNS